MENISKKKLEIVVTKKIAFQTLGCRMNQYETDSLASKFQQNGYTIVEFNSPEADVYVINTCTVTHQSDRKSRNLLNNAIRHKNGGQIVVLTGCMATHYKDELLKRGDIDYVVDNDHKYSVFAVVEAHFKGEIANPNNYDSNVFGYEAADHTFHTRSMIKIQDGCNHYCTYCIVPFVRGKAVSRPLTQILDNITQVINFGYKEIVLTGVNIGSYNYNGLSFDDLLEQILNLPYEFRVRISSIEPDGFGDKFIGLFLHPKMTPHLHLCLQSGSNKILRSMRRMYSVESYINIIEQLRYKIPSFNITTDIIVGFPDETDEDFKQTCNIIEQLNFGHIHTFTYSLRKGTRAAKMPNQIPDKIKQERSKIIHILAHNNKQRYRKTFIGQTQRVLIEKFEQDEMPKGYGQHYIPIKIASHTNVHTNNFYDVKIIDLTKDDELTLLAYLNTNVNIV